VACIPTSSGVYLKGDSVGKKERPKGRETGKGRKKKHKSTRGPNRGWKGLGHKRTIRRDFGLGGGNQTLRRGFEGKVLEWGGAQGVRRDKLPQPDLAKGGRGPFREGAGGSDVKR